MVAMNAPPKFPLGQVVATPSALEALAESNQSAAEFLNRHVRGDYGDVCAEDKALNHQAIVEGTRILSSYRTAKGRVVWVITEADRSSTCLLLPEEY